MIIYIYIYIYTYICIINIIVIMIHLRPEGLGGTNAIDVLYVYSARRCWTYVVAYDYKYNDGK